MPSASARVTTNVRLGLVGELDTGAARRLDNHTQDVLLIERIEPGEVL